MARQFPNPDRDFCAGYERRDPEIERLLLETPLAWDDLLDDPEVRARVGKMIAEALLRRDKPDLH